MEALLVSPNFCNVCITANIDTFLGSIHINHGIGCWQLLWAKYYNIGYVSSIRGIDIELTVKADLRFYGTS